MKNIVLSALTVLSLLTASCSDDDTRSVSKDLEIQNFVWSAMNTWYNWQTSVPNLDNAIGDNSADYTAFLNGFDSPEDLFDNLLYNPGITDRFSWFVDDYVVLNQQFQGISKSFGFRLSGVILNDNNATTDDDAILYVRYVAPNSPASDAGIQRGDIINAIDGTILKDSNFNNITANLANETVSFTFVSENNGVLTLIGDKSITSIVLSENPVHFSKIFNNVGGKKVGYLVYNGFRTSFNDELNAVFANFLAEGIEELVLDLRLNGGGSVETTSYLASMIYAGANTGKFADLKFNAKNTNQNGSYNFDNTLSIYNSNGDETGTETINRLTTLNRLFVLTSGSTASASEMIINGMRSYFDVRVIGTTTFGKNVGSITLYDSPSSRFTSEASANPDHNNAMQPIVFQIFNKDGESDYTNGFEPEANDLVRESDFWYDIRPFGDENEVVLKTALDAIGGVVTKSLARTKNLKRIEIKQLDRRFDKEMYISYPSLEQLK